MDRHQSLEEFNNFFNAQIKPNLNFDKNHHHKHFCKFCDSVITNYNHYKTCCFKSKKYYYFQLKLILSLFDNFDVSGNIDLTQFGVDQLFDKKFMFNVFKTYYSEELFRVRANIVSGRAALIAKSGTSSILNEWKNDSVFLTIKDTVAKHSTSVIAYKDHTEQKKKIKKVTQGHLVPRIDIPNVEGCRSSWEANIYRILNLEHKRFVTEIPFKLPDIYNKTKRGYQEYLVDFIDIDNFFGYGENTYVEIKGYYDDHAEEKSSLFKKFYPNKKLIFIGINDVKANFYPEINYYDLQKKYAPLIPMWETKSHSVFSHPEDFLPQSLVEKSVVEYRPLQSENFKKLIQETELTTSQKKSITIRRSFIRNKLNELK